MPRHAKSATPGAAVVPVYRRRRRSTNAAARSVREAPGPCGQHRRHRSGVSSTGGPRGIPEPTTGRHSAAMPLLLGLLWMALGPLAPAGEPWRPPTPSTTPLTVYADFAPPLHPWGAGHRGIDLRVPARSPVLSAGAGVVTVAGPVIDRGVVVVQHVGGLRTTYEPVRATVRVGQTVAAGATLGTLQTRGSHCRPMTCLHWGLRRGPSYLDPLLLLQPGPAGQVRLLPEVDAGLERNRSTRVEAPTRRRATSAPAVPTRPERPAEAEPSPTDRGTRLAVLAASGGVAVAMLAARRRVVSEVMRGDAPAGMPDEGARH